MVSFLTSFVATGSDSAWETIVLRDKDNQDQGSKELRSRGIIFFRLVISCFKPNLFKMYQRKEKNEKSLTQENSGSEIQIIKDWYIFFFFRRSILSQKTIPNFGDSKDKWLSKQTYMCHFVSQNNNNYYYYTCLFFQPRKYFPLFWVDPKLFLACSCLFV